MGLKCRISYDKSGTVSVYDENGSPSRLFEDILTEVNNQSTALDLWALAQTDEFQESVDGFVTAQDVMKYADTDSSQHTQLTDAQKVSVRSILNTSGIRSLSELNETLLRTFKPNGVFEFNPRRAEESGLYTEEELRDLDQIALQEVMTVIEGQVQLYDIVVDEQNTEGSEYIDSSSKDILGRFQRVTEEKFNDDVNQLAELANDEAQLREAVMELPYTDFVNEFLENEQFRNEQTQRLQRLSVIPELHFDGDTLVNEDLSAYSTVRNTVDFDANTTEILADIQILEEMSPVGWDQQAEVKSALRSVAKDLIKYRVDLIGLEELSNEPDQVLNLLRAAEQMLDKPTKNNIQTFVALKQEYLPSAKPKRIESLPENYQGYNIVSVRTAKSDQTLFENGLIKVGNDLYHKVQLEDKSTIYDYVYDMYVRGEFSIPDHLKTVRSGIADFNNKIEVLKDIEAYINSRDTGLEVNDQELLSLYQVAFEHNPVTTVEPVNRVKKVSSVNTDAEYLKDGFVNDFYEYYLEQKLENSDIYQDILSKFEFNSKGITLVGEVASLDNMKYSTEIKDYLRLRKDFDSELLSSDTAGNMTNAELLALNFPETVREHSGEVVTEGVYAVVPHTTTDFYRIDGKLYRRMLSRSDASLFMEVNTEDSAIFYDTNTNFPFNLEQAQQVFDSLQLAPEQVTQEQVEEIFKQAKFQNKLSPRKGKSLDQLRSGEHTLEDSDTLYKGLDGKEDLGGQRINAHQGVNGIFAATDIKLAEEYGAISTINVPAGTTVEVIEVSPKGKTPDAYRQAEVEAINNSNAQIVKLRTMDGIMRKGERLQEQYIIKDEGLISEIFAAPNLENNRARFQIISEKGAQKIEQYKNLLDKAKELEKNNVSLSDITDQTGWFKYKGDWRFFSNEALEQFKINENAIRQGTEQKLSDILSTDNILFNMYPTLGAVKVVISQDSSLPKNASYNEGGKIIKANLFEGRELEAAIAHEISHFIQRREGLPQGGNYNLLLQQLVNELDFIPKGVSLTLNQVTNLLNENKTESNKAIVDAALSLLDNNTNEAKYKVYRAVMGEMDAHMVTKAYTNRETPYTYLELLDEELIEQKIADTDVIIINSQGEVSFSPKPNNTSAEVTQQIIDQLQKTGLAENVYQLSSQEIENKLEELGVSEDIRKQVAQGLSNTPTWVSNAKEGIAKIKQGKATPEQWLKQIAEKGGKGTTQELEWIGLQDFLDSYITENNTKSVPKEVVEQYINDNQIEIVEVEKGKPIIEKEDLEVEFDGSGFVIRYNGTGNLIAPYITLDQIDLTEEDTYEEDFDYYSAQEAAKEAAIEEMLDREDGEVKYSEYQLEGGENYREVLLTLPNLYKGDVMSFEKWVEQWYGDISDLTENQIRLARTQYESKVGQKSGVIENFYKSSHWGEANILAHLRLNERTLPNGERVMFIEEVQSDWAQEGKKMGFDDKTQDLTPRYKRLDNGIDFWEIGDETQKGEVYFDPDRTDATVYTARAGNKMQDFDNKEDAIKWAQDNIPKQRGVTPNMPYKKTDQWVGMAMRRAIQMASQEGFDRIAWVTGEQSADRYDLSKQIDAIDIEPKINNSRYVNLKMPQGQNIVMNVDSNGNISESSSQFNNKNLEDVIGKELAQKVLSTPDNERTTLKEDGLKIGGEGMKTFYNSILPKVAKKEAQRFDKKAKVDVVEINQTKDDADYQYSELSDGTFEVEYKGDTKEFKTEKEVDKYISENITNNKSKQLSIKITPKMKENLSQGVPLFQKQLEKNGIKVIPNGFAINNEVYLNKDTMNGTTPIHEFNHLYNSWLKQNRPEVYKKGLDLVEAELGKTNSEIQDVIDYVKQTQPNLEGEALREETLTELVGRKGLEKITDQKQSGIIEWLKEAWQAIKNMLGISQMTTEQILNLDLQSYADAMAVDLLSGESLKTISTSQLQELSQNSVDILTSEIKVLDLYDASEESTVKDEFDNCG